MICLVCRKTRPSNRPKYCSNKCVKRAWRLKNNIGVSFFHPNNRAAWYKTQTGIAYKWELYAEKILGGKWQGFCAPYDVIWKDKKIDVKVCELYFKKPYKSGQWVFNKHSRGVRRDKKLDYLFCIGLVNGKPKKIWLIPYDSVKTGITIGQKSKYDRYLF